MDRNKQIQLKKTLPAKHLSDAGEMNRLHMQYAGIFKNNIPEFAEKIKVMKRRSINFSR